MTRAPVLAAGGIVLRPARTTLVAVVRLRKSNEGVLPKGKLDDGETPRAAAEREVQEETGHDVCVHEFLGTLAYEAGGRPKIVHYWRMETSGRPSRDLMNDVRAVEWLPLKAAVGRLSRVHEQAFLANVGPLALEAAVRAKQSRARKAPSFVKRRRPAALPPPAPPVAPPEVEIPLTELAPPPFVATDVGFEAVAVSDVAEANSTSMVEAFLANETNAVEEAFPDSAPMRDEPIIDEPMTDEQRHSVRLALMRKVKAWLRRAA